MLQGAVNQPGKAGLRSGGRILNFHHPEKFLIHTKWYLLKTPE
jgi:hypothetical protein